MALAVRPVRGVPEHLRDRRVGVLQRVEGQPALAVLVVEQPHELVRDPLVPPAGEALRNRRRQIRVVGRPGRVTGRTQEQVEDERDAVALREWPNLVQAIRVERREGQLGRLARVEVQDLFLPPMANDQLSSGPRRGQRQREGCDHARHLLGVPVLGEEPSRTVDEEFVELGAEPFGGQPKTGGHEIHQLREGVRPCVPGQTDSCGVDLPAVANRRVHEGLGPLAEGRALRRCDQRPDLRVRDRKRELSGSVHDDAWHGCVEPSADAIVAGTVDGPQEMFEPLVLVAVFDAVDAHLRLRVRVGVAEGHPMFGSPWLLVNGDIRGRHGDAPRPGHSSGGAEVPSPSRGQRRERTSTRPARTPPGFPALRCSVGRSR